MIENFRYIPPRKDEIEISEVNVTDRSAEKVIDMLGLENIDIQTNDKVVVSGAGLCFSFEQYLKNKGASVTTIDQSLSFTSDRFVVAAFDGLTIRPNQVAKYFRKMDKIDVFSKDLYKGEDFKTFQRSRWEIVRKTCNLVIGGTLPQTKMANYISAKFIFDLYGPAHYIKSFEIIEYLQDIINTLKPGGLAIIYSLGFGVPTDTLNEIANNWGRISEDGNVIDCTPYGEKGIKIKKN